MNEENKSLELAKLMGWNVSLRCEQDEYHTIKGGEDLRPYDDCTVGLCQFAKIFLKFPQCVDSFHTF